MYNQDAIDWAWGVEIVPRKGMPTLAVLRLTLVCLSRYADDGWQAWPAVDSIASDTGLGHSSVQRATHSLTSLGLLSAESRKRDTTIYTLEGVPQTPKTTVVTSGVPQTPSKRSREGAFRRGWDAHAKHAANLKARAQSDKA